MLTVFYYSLAKPEVDDVDVDLTVFLKYHDVLWLDVTVDVTEFMHFLDPDCKLSGYLLDCVHVKH